MPPYRGRIEVFEEMNSKGVYETLAGKDCCVDSEDRAWGRGPAVSDGNGCRYEVCACKAEMC